MAVADIDSEFRFTIAAVYVLLKYNMKSPSLVVNYKCVNKYIFI